MKSKSYPAIAIAALSGALLMLLLDRLLGFFSLPSNPSGVQPPLPTLTPTPPPIASPSPTPTPLPTPTPTPPPATPPASPTALRPGKLRVSNQSQHPLRVALLQSQSADRPTLEPVHWDFAPAEGGSRGLILSLPDRDLQVQEGDVLVAFAQDGSRRYWGPYVVGETAAPSWAAAESEWQLTLTP